MLDNVPSRYILIEFAGMPKSGKTTVLDVVSHFLRRHQVPLSEYHGGGRYAPIGKDQLGRLNLYLASEALRYVLSSTQVGWAPKVHLMDRGLVDRTIFTEALLKVGRIGASHAGTIRNMVALPEVAGLVDVCAIFVTSPELSLQREQKNKLVQRDGRVMNTSLLSDLGEAATAIANHHDGVAVANEVFLVDTAVTDGNIEQTALEVLRKIAPVLQQGGVRISLPEHING